MTTLAQLKTLSRAAIESSFDISGKKGKEGTTFRAGNYAIKLFKPTKAVSAIRREVGMQQRAAEYGVAPAVHHVSPTGKFIIMDALEETIVEKGKREGWTALPEDYAAQIYALCKRLDTAKVVQNDGNPLNLMLDANERLYVIDYGFAKLIDKKMLKRRGPQPNVDLTLWHFSRQLQHYKFRNDLSDRIVQKYLNDHSFVDEALLAKGERLLGTVGASKPAARPRTTAPTQQTPRKPRKRRTPAPPAPKKPAAPRKRRTPAPPAPKKPTASRKQRAALKEPATTLEDRLRARQKGASKPRPAQNRALYKQHVRPSADTMPSRDELIDIINRRREHKKK